MAIFIAIPLFYDKNFWPEYALPTPYNDIVALALISAIIVGLYRVAKK